MIVLENNKLRFTNNNYEVAIYNCLQEIQLFLGENPYRSELGIDYLGVFSNDVYYKDKLQNVIDNHADNFKDITISSYGLSDDGAYLNVTVAFTYEDNTVIKNISIGGNT